MSIILAELFGTFSPEEQAYIRAAEAGASGIIAEGEQGIRDRLRVSGSMEDRDWILEPQDQARWGAANSEFVAYCNVLWGRTDLSSQESVRGFLTHLDTTCRGVFAKYGQWECREGITALRAEAERLAWMAHARELAIARSVTSQTSIMVSTDTSRESDDGAGTRQTAEFWRSIGSDFRALSKRQDDVLRSTTHTKWIKGYCFYLDGTGDFSRCRIEGGFDGVFFSDVVDVATRAGCALGCPAEVDPAAFWLMCMARDLLKAQKREIRNEFLGERESSGIIQGFLASSIGYCSRLAARAEREAHNSRFRPERQQPEPTTDRRATDSTGMTTDFGTKTVTASTEDEVDPFVIAYEEVAARSEEALTAIKQKLNAPKRRALYQDLEHTIWSSWQVRPEDVTVQHIIHALHLLSRKSRGGVELDPLSCEAYGIDHARLTTLMRASMAHMGDPSTSPKVPRVSGTHTEHASQRKADQPPDSDGAVLVEPITPGKRGRKTIFTQKQLDEARQMKSDGKINNEIAKILYRTNTPTPEQRRSVSTTLKHHFGSKT